MSLVRLYRLDTSQFEQTCRLSTPGEFQIQIFKEIWETEVQRLLGWYFSIPINFELYCCFALSPDIHSLNNYLIWQHIPLCNVWQYLTGFHIDKRSNYSRTETTLIHLMTHQSLNSLQKADRSSTVGIYFLGSRVKQSLITPWELSAQEREQGG